MQALEGLKVIELGQLIAGPFAGKTLADFGADVIKIEPANVGDPLRKWRMLRDGTSVWWQVQSRNKRSVCLDLKSAEGQETVRALAKEADVLIENFKPGTLEKWGLGWERLHALNPKLIMLRISGYGQTGPYREKPGFGALGEAMGGLRHLTGEPGRIPVRVGVSIGDTLAALHGVIGVLMALHHRHAHDGEGQFIDVALYEAVFNVMESLVPECDAFGAVRGAAGSALPGIAPNVPVNVSLSCSFGCPMEGDVDPAVVLDWVSRCARLGVRGVTLCDTTGMAYPTQVQSLCESTIEHNAGLEVTAHFHNTRAMGLANTVAAIQAGIRSFDMSLGGIGGCPYAPGASGNVATEDVVHMLQCMGYETGMNLEGLIAAAGQLETLIEHPLPSQISRAGPRLTRHDPPRDFEQIVARAHARDAETARY